MILSRFRVKTYDLLIIDIMLPRMDGFELYDKMKEIDNKIKVCLVTVYDINRGQYLLCPLTWRHVLFESQLICRNLLLEIRITSNMKAVRSATIVKEIRSTFLIVL